MNILYENKNEMDFLTAFILIVNDHTIKCCFNGKNNFTQYYAMLYLFAFFLVLYRFIEKC